MKTGQDRKQVNQAALGTEIHARFNRVLKNRNKKGEGEWTDKERQVLEVVEDIEKLFRLEIVCSEKRISGFSTDLKGREGSYYWSGRIDAIGLMNGDDKDGCDVIVLDWITCSDVGSFWVENPKFKVKLHQNMIYRRLLAVHMREYFEDPNIPEPGIMIVALEGENVHVKDPRLCMDFSKLENAGIFKKLDQFKWEANSFSQNESAEGHKKAIYTVRSLLLVRSVN